MVLGKMKVDCTSAILRAPSDTVHGPDIGVGLDYPEGTFHPYDSIDDYLSFGFGVVKQMFYT